MKLRRLGRTRWDVLAVCDEAENCFVLDFLSSIDQTLAAKMLFLLENKLPELGPLGMRSNESKKISEHIYELKRRPKSGAQVRIFYFFDGQKTIVCTNGFIKRNKLDRTALEQAEQMRRKYFMEKESGTLKILDPNE